MAAWTYRTRARPDGSIERWRERPVPGEPGVVHRHHYEVDERGDTYRLGPAPTLVFDGAPSRTSFQPLAGYRSTSTSTPLASREPKFTTDDVVRESWTGHVSVRILEGAYPGFLRQQETQYGPQRIGDDVEIGGGLFGSYANEQFVIADVSGRILPDYAERSSGRLDVPYIEMRADDHRIKKTGLKLLGFWHSHPGIDGGDSDRGLFACPSSSDLNCLEALHERSPVRIGSFKWPVLGLIVAPRYVDDEEAGWNRPLVTGFVARGEENYPKVEFARVRVEGKRDQAAWSSLPGFPL